MAPFYLNDFSALSHASSLSIVFCVRIVVILDLNHAASPAFASVLSDAMRDEEKETLIAESPEAVLLQPLSKTKSKYKNARESKKPTGS